MAGQPDLCSLQLKCLVFDFLGSNALQSFEIPPRTTASERVSPRREECFGITDWKHYVSQQDQAEPSSVIALISLCLGIRRSRRLHR